MRTGTGWQSAGGKDVKGVKGVKGVKDGLEDGRAAGYLAARIDGGTDR